MVSCRHRTKSRRTVVRRTRLFPGQADANASRMGRWLGLAPPHSILGHVTQFFIRLDL
jgi:hypothetical protein